MFCSSPQPDTYESFFQWCINCSCLGALIYVGITNSGASDIVANHVSQRRPTDESYKRFMVLMSDLGALTNKLVAAHVESYVTADSVLQNSAQATMALGLLRRIRAGQTNDAIEMLESQLDWALIRLTDYPKEVGEDQVKLLQNVNQYRMKFPRTTDSSDHDAEVKKAFELLDKK
jgi:hypothetical protein